MILKPKIVSSVFMMINHAAESESRGHLRFQAAGSWSLVGGVAAIVFTLICWILCKPLTQEDFNLFVIITPTYIVTNTIIRLCFFRRSHTRLMRAWQDKKRSYFGDKAFQDAYEALAKGGTLTIEHHRHLNKIVAECDNWWEEQHPEQTC